MKKKKLVVLILILIFSGLFSMPAKAEESLSLINSYAQLAPSEMSSNESYIKYGLIGRKKAAANPNKKDNAEFKDDARDNDEDRGKADSYDLLLPDLNPFNNDSDGQAPLTYAEQNHSFIKTVNPCRSPMYLSKHKKSTLIDKISDECSEGIANWDLEKVAGFDGKKESLVNSLTDNSTGLANVFSWGNGVVYISGQVRRGVRNALVDVFNGYPEFQRRKQAQEILNANLVANQIATSFLIGGIKSSRKNAIDKKRELRNNQPFAVRKYRYDPSDNFDNSEFNESQALPSSLLSMINADFMEKQEASFSVKDQSFLGRVKDSVKNLARLIHAPGSDRIGVTDPFYREYTNPVQNQILRARRSNPSLMEVAEKILKSDFASRLNEIFAHIARLLLVLAVFFLLFRRLSDHGFSLSYAIVEPMMLALGLWMAISYSPHLIDLIFKAMKFINEAVMINMLSLSNFEGLEDFMEKVFRGWRFIGRNVGYFPSILLSAINIISQCLAYFYILGVLLHIIIGKIISPIWFLLGISDSTRSQGLNSFINWLKSLLVIVFIPVIYFSLILIQAEFASTNQHFLNVIFSMASFILLPVISGALLTSGSGVFQSFFSGYEVLVDTINSSFSNLRNAMETQPIRSLSDSAPSSRPGFDNSFINRAYSPGSQIRNSLNFDSFLDRVRSATVDSVGTDNLSKADLKSRIEPINKSVFIEDRSQMSSNAWNFADSVNNMKRFPNEVFKPFGLHLDKIIKLEKLKSLGKL